MNDDTRKYFYAPHPGIGGAAVPLPLQLKVVADGLDGKVMSIARATEILKAVAPTAEVEDVAKGGYLMLKFHFGNGGMHAWRIIRYRTP